MFIKRIPGEQSPPDPKDLARANGIGPALPTGPTRLSAEILSRIRAAVAIEPSKKDERRGRRDADPA